MLRFLTFIFFISTPVGAQIYTWVDEKGETHFSDTPVNGSKPKTVEIDVHKPSDLQRSIDNIESKRKSARLILEQKHARQRRLSDKALNRRIDKIYADSDKRQAKYAERRCKLAKRHLKETRSQQRDGYTVSQSRFIDRRLVRYRQQIKDYC